MQEQSWTRGNKRPSKLRKRSQMRILGAIILWRQERIVLRPLSLEGFPSKNCLRKSVQSPFYVEMQFAESHPESSLLDFEYGNIIKVTKVGDYGLYFGERRDSTCFGRNTGWFSVKEHTEVAENYANPAMNLLSTAQEPSQEMPKGLELLWKSIPQLVRTPVKHAEDSVDAYFEPPLSVEFTHTEYQSYKIVPFKTFKQLGHGSLGSVDAVRPSGDETGPLLARKVIRLPNMARKRLLPLIQQEVAVLRGLRHRHIVQVVSRYETTCVPRQFGILLSPAGDEDLSHYLERVWEKDFPEEDLVRLQSWTFCLTSAVAYIHSQNIRHKDIKPSNIICKGDEVLLTDSGSAHQFSAELTSSTEGYTVGITKMYSASEAVAFDRRGRSADIDSLGCVIVEVCTVSGGRRIEDFHDFRSEPVPDEPDRMTLVYHATSHKLEAWFAMQNDAWPFSLISLMMADDPKARPTAEALLTILAERYTPQRCNFIFEIQEPRGYGTR